MKEEIEALLVHSSDFPMAGLKKALENQLIQTDRARTCKEAGWRLTSSNPPHLVFTDTDLLDGSWTDVVDLAAGAREPVNVIVVSPFVDIPLYMAVMERRAFDFITHSFTVPELNHILCCAVEDVSSRRKKQAHLRGESTRRAIGPGMAIFKEI